MKLLKNSEELFNWANENPSLINSKEPDEYPCYGYIDQDNVARFLYIKTLEQLLKDLCFLCFTCWDIDAGLE